MANTLLFIISVVSIIQTHTVYGQDQGMEDPIFGDGVIFVSGMTVYNQQHPIVQRVCAPVILVAASWHVGWRIGTWIRCEFIDRRRLQSDAECEFAEVTWEYNVDDVPITVNCVNDPICKELLVGALYSGPNAYDPQDRCNLLGLNCNTPHFELYGDAVDELNTLETCPTCVTDEFILVNDGMQRTWGEAREYCLAEYNADLATINDDNLVQLACAVGYAEGLGLTPFIGLYAPWRAKSDHAGRPYYYVNADGSSCPVADTCLGSDAWDGEPLPCKEGSQCVRYLVDEGRIVNDIQCNEKLSSFLCNGVDTATGFGNMCTIVCSQGFTTITCPLNKDASCSCDYHGRPVAECT